MRNVMLVLLLLVPPVAQEQEAKKPPKPLGRGDLVEARGCIKGGVLESSDLNRPESESRYTDFITFRLTGDKKLLEEVRKDHDGHADILRGELRTDLPKTSETPGTRVGNTRITVGVMPGRTPGMEPPPPPMPVLKVTGIEHTGVNCRPQS